MSRTKLFREMKESEKRAKLFYVVSQKTSGRLSANEIEKIVNSIDIEHRYTIKIFSDAKEFGEELTLMDHYDDDESITQEGKTVLGEVEFGESHWVYKWNELQDKTNTEPQFNYLNKAAVAIETCECDEKTEWKYELLIYIPEVTPYKVDPEIAYILEHFNIK